jgi:hypothetical protein
MYFLYSSGEIEIQNDEHVLCYRMSIAMVSVMTLLISDKVDDSQRIRRLTYLRTSILRSY